MADFKIAYDITAKNEGGWVKNPHDSGGETIFGISRNNWSGWPGWLIVDDCKHHLGDVPMFGTQGYLSYARLLTMACRANSLLMGQVSDFYRANFWNGFDAINSQEVASKLYDAGVNMGTGAAAKIMQRCVGATPDGSTGPHSIQAINSVDPDDLLAQFKAARIQYYKDIVAAHPQDAQFLEDWISRC